MAVELKPDRALNRSFLRNHESPETKERFRKALQTLLLKLDADEDEEHNKIWIRDFLTHSFYDEPYQVNTSGKVDQAIFGPDSLHPWILMEMKAPGNSLDMPKDGNFDRKGFCQLVLYYLKEEKECDNREIKHLAVTNGIQWYVFERKLFYNCFGTNRNLWNRIKQYEREKKTRDEIYHEVIAPEVRKVQNSFTYVYFDLGKFANLLDDSAILHKRIFEALCKFFSPTHLCMQPYDFDHNHLDTKFYNELLYLMGVEEKRVGQLDVIQRLPEKERQHYSLLEQTIWHLTELGVDDSELYDVAIGLVISWINRILFLKLLETQLVNFNGGCEKYKFLSPSGTEPSVVSSYHDLFDLFFKVLSKTEKERDAKIGGRYNLIPYLNSALFEVSELEKQYFTINALPYGSIKVYSATVLKDESGKTLRGTLGSLEYLLRFLEAYDFGTYERDEQEEDEEQKTLIDASVLGLIFEKINGYKEGAYFTPGYICEYMCRETIERAVVTRINEAFDWQCETTDEIVEHLDYHNSDVRRKANEAIDSIRICDPSVGSGHFLVSALNEMIAVKQRLHVLCYSSYAEGYANERVKGWSIDIGDDELVITDKEHQKPFVYDRNDKEASALQRTLFEEKRRIISGCLYGVDINQKSVDICRLRLWIELLKNAYYDNGHLQTLPNIDINIKQGDALMSHIEVKVNTNSQASASKSIHEITGEYKNLTDAYKKGSGHRGRHELNRKLNDVKRELRSYIQSDFLDFEIARMEKKDTEQNYLEWMLEFPELLDDDGNFLGFDILVGNPPYIGLGADGGRLRKRYRGRGYQTFNSKGDIYFLFYERALQLLRGGGLFCFITSNKWLRNDAAKELRNYLAEHTLPLLLIDFPGLNLFKRATVVNSILMARNQSDGEASTLCATTEGKEVNDVKNMSLFVEENQLYCHFAKGQQWLILPDEKRAIMQKMLEKGKPLGQWEEATVRYGVKTGRNNAFIISTAQREHILDECKTEEERQRTEAVLHPFIEGCDIHRYQHQWADKWVIGFYPSLHINIEKYPTLKNHLLLYSKDWLIQEGHSDIANEEAKMLEFGRLFLEQTGKRIVMDGRNLKDSSGRPIKSRKKTSHKWFETSDSIAFHQEFKETKIAWGNLNNQASCTWMPEEMHINAPAVMVTPGTKYLLAVLNSRLADFFMQTIAVVRNGGYYEYKPQFVKMIPIIEHPTEEQISKIESLALCALAGEKEAEREIDIVLAEMYGLSPEETNLVIKG
ncbi:MAG: Eco57I restriction-modification methylase domain-containing protein [Bacteroidaceae bacterium]|nr:Eco57I restriction-modification methylase domain-containing protein [Bacteroidaceae bacterium]